MRPDARIVALTITACALLTPAAHAQGDLGAYYGNMYFQTHVAMNLLREADGMRGGTRRRVRRVHAAPTWIIAPARSVVIKRMVEAAPAAARPQYRDLLARLLQNTPKIMQAASQGEGVTLHPSSSVDVATLAGVLAFQELTGKDLTNAQFAAEREATKRWHTTHYPTQDQVQQGAETYALAIGLMASLKQYAQDPKNPNPTLTRQQLHQLVLDTFKAGYGSTDYTKFAATSRGIVKAGS